MHRRRERQLGELGNLEASLATTGEAVLRDLPDAFVLHRIRLAMHQDDGSMLLQVGIGSGNTTGTLPACSR